MDEAVILRYLKVRALSERGAPGERENAVRIRVKLEAENPGLARAAEDYLRRKEREMNGETSSPHPSDVRAERSPFVGNWENIFKFAHAAYSQAAGFADVLAQGQRARELGARVRSETRVSKNNENLLVVVKVPLDVYERALGLSPVSREIFRRALHDCLDEELDAMFNQP
jgi:hypothetical protein